jgi:hypothetical protein
LVIVYQKSNKEFKNLKIFFYHLIISTILFLIGISSSYAEDKLSSEFLVGGQCDYKQYKGLAKIVSIAKLADSTRYSHERYEVKFKFTSDQEIKESFVQTEGREYLLMLGHSYYPGPKFLEKYRIEVGKVFECYLKVITKGSCTPILFDFPTIRLDDYFEN